MFNKLFISFLLICCTGLVFSQSPEALSKLTNSKLTEVSGIIPSTQNKGLFWVHNDSGNKSEIYLINQKSKLELTVELGGITLIDTEDIARRIIDGTTYLVLADIGNNLKLRDTLSLYVFKEPKWTGNDHQVIKHEDINQIKFRYSDIRRDAEAIFVDPLTNAVYLISKRDFRSALFTISLNNLNDTVQNVSKLMDLPLTFSTAADISSDGKHILIKNLTNIYAWDRVENESILETLKRKPKEIPYLIEPQGEAICFDLNDHYFYTISERPLGLDSYLYKYKY